jgi:hypothetical protein
MWTAGAPFVLRIVVYKHVAANIIVLTVCPVEPEGFDQQNHLIPVPWRFHRFSVITGQVVFGG